MDISDIASPDAEMTTNEDGGSQSHIPVRFDLIDGKALFEMAAVLHEGAEKYGEDNWRLIPVKDHLNHLLMHTYAYLSGDRTDDHLSHILCRATFAQGVVRQTPDQLPPGVDIPKWMIQEDSEDGKKSCSQEHVLSESISWDEAVREWGHLPNVKFDVVGWDNKGPWVKAYTQ